MSIAHRHRRAVQLAFFLGVAILALVLMRLIPAFQSPDETAHLNRADMLAHGQVLLRKDGPEARGTTGGHADLHLIRFGHWMVTIRGLGNPSGLSANAMMDEASRHGWAHTEHFIDAMGSAYNVPLIYLPHAIGLGLSRHLDWSLRASYEFTRALVALSSLALMAWAWALLPPNLLARALVVMPMTVFQILSPTVDGLCTALALVLLGLVLRQYREGPAQAQAWQTAAIYLCTFLLATSRANLLPIVGLPLLLLWRHYSRPRLLAFAGLCLACAGWTLFVLLTSMETRIARPQTTVQVISAYAAHPLDFAMVVLNTLRDPEKGFFLAYSFVGILGWLDTLIPRHAMQAIWGILLAALAWTAVQARRERRHRPPAEGELPLRLMLLACGAVSALLVFFALAVTWNVYPTATIGGVQGRYFLIPALLAAMAVGPLHGPDSRQGGATVRPWPENLAFLAVACYCLYVLATTLSARYQMQVF